MKILVIRIDGIGDNIMNIPFMKELRNNFIDSTIDIYIRPYVYPTLEFCPYIDNFLFYWNEFPYKIDHDILKNSNIINRNNYDLILCSRWGEDCGMSKVLRYVKNVRKIGFSIQDNHPEEFLTDIITCNEFIHDVDANMKILHNLNIKTNKPRLEFFGNTNRIILNSIFDELKDKYFVVSIGSSCNERKWNIHNYINLIEKIQHNFDIWCVIEGGTDVIEDSRFIMKNIKSTEKVLNLAGKTNIGDTYEIIKKSIFLIGNDSGMIHLGAAANKPIISIFKENFNPNREKYLADPIRHYPYCNKYWCVLPEVNDNINTINFDEVYCYSVDALNTGV